MGSVEHTTDVAGAPSFWQRYLADAPAFLELPTDRPRPAALSTARDSVRLQLSAQLSAALAQVGERCGVTSDWVVLAGCAALVSRISGQNDVVLGVLIPGRGLTALRVRFETDLSTRALLSRITTDIHDTEAAAGAPFEQWAAAVAAASQLSHHPIFQVTVALDDSLSAAAGVTRMHAENLPPLATAPLDLVFSVHPAGPYIAVGIDYATDLFERSSMERMTGHLRTLLEGIATDVDAALSRLPILPHAERDQVLVQFNATQRSFPADRLIHEFFEHHARETPDSIAVVYKDKKLTYGELNAVANQLAHHLRELGVKPDTLVAICLERGLEMAAGLLGVLKCGGAYLPLDPAYPAERLAFMLKDSAPAVLLTQPYLNSMLANCDLPLVVLLDLAERESEIARQPAWDLRPGEMKLTPAHLAYVIYTSGSTGRPKGVMVEHRGLTNLALAQSRLFGVDAGSCVLQFASFGFDASVSECVMALSSGARLVLAPLEDLYPGEPLKATLRIHQVTHVTLPPSALTALSKDGVSESLTLILAGQALPVTLARRWSANRLFNAYGPTETTVCATVYRCEPGCPDPVPIGGPIDNTQIYVLDPGGEPVPIGVEGEIHIGGIGVARGYLNRPELTAKTFVPDRFSGAAAARLYRTGDRARWLADGTLQYLGRKDFQVKLRGYRIELGEIESQLRTFPGVEDAVVVVREDDPGDYRLVAYYMPAAAGAVVGARELRTHLLTRLPEYMVPAVYVPMQSFPLTANGKLDRPALPAPGYDAVTRVHYEAPLGPVEIAIAQIWQTLLHVERVGRHDNFFKLGGHSLLIVEFAERVKKLWARPVSVSWVYRAPTPAQLATLMSALDVGNKYRHVVKLNDGGFRNPLFCLPLIEGDTSAYVHLARFIDPSIPVYGLEAGLRGDEEHLRSALDALAESYEREIRRVQPKGPYRLCGYSFGGAAAYELATRFEAAGDEVTLILIDAYRYSQLWLLLSKISDMLNTVRARRVIRTLKVKFGKLFIYKNHPWLTGKDKNLARAMSRQAMNRTYVPFSGRVVLFKTTEREADAFRFQLDGHNGWTRYVKGEFEVIHLASGHHALVKEPSVHALVSHMNTILSH